MPCAPCQAARAQFYGAVRRGDWMGAASAVRTAAAINVDKLRGVDVTVKYGGKPAPKPATPYRRPPERSP
jgi:hypothetical protein